MMDGRYAAIDIGTVTCRMLVADVRSGELIPLAKEYRIVNLGEGVDATHRLSEQAMERTEAALADYLAVRAAFDTPEHPLRATMTVATSASRDADNADDFRAMLSRLGLELNIISGEEEAALTFRGATRAWANEQVAVVDVGGGSTEITIGTAGEAIAHARSFNVGSRRETERFLASDPPTPEELAEVSHEAHRAFVSWIEGISPLQPLSRVLAVAGTATSAVSVREHMRVYDAARVNGAQVTIAELEALTCELAALPLDARRSVVGLDPGRAPVIVAGLAILVQAVRALGMSACTVSESDILDGMILACAETQEHNAPST